MADKYLYNNAGQPEEKEAIVTSAGAGSAGKIIALDGTGKLDTTVLPTGIGAETVSKTASEILAAGDLVNFHGTGQARKADASNLRRAHGFVLSGVSSGSTANVYLEGSITGLTGLTEGEPYYLSGTTPGQATITAPSTAGYISQEIGCAASTTVISFEPQQPIKLA